MNNYVQMTKAQKLINFHTFTLSLYTIYNMAEKMGVFDHILLMSGSNAGQFRKEKKKKLKES